jgi:hypothetical protein
VRELFRNLVTAQAFVDAVARRARRRRDRRRLALGAALVVLAMLR